MVERIEEWTPDGKRFVSVPIDKYGRVTVDYPILRKLLLDLGFTKWSEAVDG